MDDDGHVLGAKVMLAEIGMEETLETLPITAIQMTVLYAFRALARRKGTTVKEEMAAYAEEINRAFEEAA